MQETTIRSDDSEVATELACQRERANWIATRYGLPAIGSKMVNQHGLEYVVQEHVAIPTYDSLHRWREGEVVPAQDLYPVIVPSNLSPKLTEFFMAIDRCTTKTFAIVDTMPGLRRDGNVPGVNHIDTICHPTANILFLDAAQVNETIIAHELGHAWVQYVDECEDLRVMEDAGDPQRMRLVGFVQSFVLDLKVNELIRQKGFDMAPIEEDQRASVVQLAQFVGNGGRSDLPREEVIWATTIADRLLQSNHVSPSALIQIDNALTVIRECVGHVFTLAERMADAVRQHGYDTHAEITASIDECLHAAFEHCGDSIELDRELIAVPSQEPNLDKWPDWIEGAPLAMKTAIGKVMAREGIPSSARWCLSDQGHHLLLSFILENGEHTESWVLEHPFPFRDPLESVQRAMENQRRHTERFEKHLAEVDRINRQNHERNEQILRQAGVSLPSMRQMPSLVVQTPRTTHAHISAARTDGLGLPLGKQLPHLPSSRSGQTTSGLFGGVLLSLPQGPRLYMAGLARFLTAVRLQEQIEGEHPYGYALNNPVKYVDPSGLNPNLMCALDCDVECKKFIAANPKWCSEPLKTPPYPPGTYPLAFAFCCDGKPHHCYCPNTPGPSKNPFIRACDKVHEHGHIPPGGCAPGYTGIPPVIYDECIATKAGIKCATEQCHHKISNDCIALDDWRCYECRRLKHACHPMPSQDWLTRYCYRCGVV